MNNVKHKCVHALCNECYMNQYTNDSNNRSSKRVRGMNYVNDENACDHVNLQVFTDNSYFDPTFVQGRKERNDIFPEKCVICQKIFSNNSRMLSVGV